MTDTTERKGLKGVGRVSEDAWRLLGWKELGGTQGSHAKKTKPIIFGDGFSSLDPGPLILNNECIDYVERLDFKPLKHTNNFL